MNSIRLMAALTLGSALAAGTAQAADVGVSINISQPGVYGRIDIGRYPQPVVYAPQPIWVQAPRVVPVQPPPPVYLWVPPAHRANWRQHCGYYRACGVPVMFVQDRWYQQHVSQGPGRQHDDHDRGHGKGHGKGHDKHHDKHQDKHHDKHHDKDRGHRD